jgi:tyrosine-protein phosphatase SIW14
MARSLQILVGLVVAALLISTPVAFTARQMHETRNFRVVRDGVLYRSAQLPLDGLKRVIHDYGIRSVVTLRDSHDPALTPPDIAEEKYCTDNEINYLRLPPLAWEDRGNPKRPAPVEVNVRKFLDVMRNEKNYPVLVHCCAGIHRTGAFTAIYRMECERWTRSEALAEMRACGYTTLDDEWDILGYLEHYRPAWMDETPISVDKPAQRRHDLPGDETNSGRIERDHRLHRAAPAGQAT